jgi:hypothetical protein
MAPVDYTSYPINPVFHPYHADTVRYGFGDWLDVYNPITDSVEQVGSNGAFGSVAWVDNCRSLRGVSFTSSVLPLVFDTQFELMDMFRREVAGCGADTATGMAGGAEIKYRIYPNPANNKLVVDVRNNEPMVFSLYTLTGIKQLEVPLTGKQTIDISALPDGLYIYETSAKEMRRGKLMIMR